VTVLHLLRRGGSSGVGYFLFKKDTGGGWGGGGGGGRNKKEKEGLPFRNQCCIMGIKFWGQHLSSITIKSGERGTGLGGTINKKIWGKKKSDRGVDILPKWLAPAWQEISKGR